MRYWLYPAVPGVCIAVLLGAQFTSGDVNPESCNQLFGFARGTMRMAEDIKVMDPKVCDAYIFLMSRYDVGKCSSVVPNAKVNGITALNPDFAVALANMLKASPGIRINSAYRDEDAQRCANPGSPNSNHKFGCAVDLAYQYCDNCASGACQWTLKNADVYGLQIRMKFCKEWNHIEPINVQQCRAKGPGGGVVPNGAAPTSGVADALRRSLGLDAQQPQEQMCTLPDGVRVPCSAIANRGAASGVPGSSGAPSGGAAPSGASAPPLGTQNTTPYASGTCSPQFYCSSNDLYYRTSTCVDQLYQRCENGCSGTSCIATSVSSLLGNALASSSASTSTSQSSDASAEKSSAPVYDQISSLLLNYGAAPVGVAATSGPLVLTVDGEDAVRLEDPAQVQQGRVFAPGTIYTTQPPPSQQTFISQDLAYSPGAPSAQAQQQTGFAKILADMRDTLLRALEYLRPFGLRQVMYGAPEYAE